MKYKNLISAVMAVTLLGTMPAMLANAEEIEMNDTEAVAMTEAPATTQMTADAAEEETQATLLTTVPRATVVSEDMQTATTEALEDAPTDAPETSATTTAVLVPVDSETTTSHSTTASVATTATTLHEVISADLKAPKIGDFKVTDPEEGESGNGDLAVISWDAVDGAEGYQIYRTKVEKGHEDTPISYTFDVKGTSYQTSDSTLVYKETIKVRAFKLVNNERVYGAWSAEKTVYMNGMKEDNPVATTTVAGTTTKANTTTAKKTTTTVKSTTAANSQTASPKTGDNGIAVAFAGAGSAALMTAVFLTMKKKKD